jgi:glyoxylase-like metal-dependent hydrolase (beta-lactamase superfamily II)
MTGTVRLKHAFLYASEGRRRKLDLFLPGAWSQPVPILCWAIEHAGRLLIVDTGETAAGHNVPFARFDVRPEQELPHALEAANLSIGDVDTVVLTHMHGDHMDGAVHVRGPVLVHEVELASSRTLGARFQQRVLRQPVPAGVDFLPFVLDGGAFGAFPRSRPLSGDGRVVAVGTAGHTAGHVSVVCIDDDGQHVLLAGDATDTVEQLRELRVDAVSPAPAVSTATMRAILAHSAEHPTVYLPSHDPDSVSRLASKTTL